MYTNEDISGRSKKRNGGKRDGLFRHETDTHTFQPWVHSWLEARHTVLLHFISCAVQCQPEPFTPLTAATN